VPPAPDLGPPQPVPPIVFRESDSMGRAVEAESRVAVAVLPKMRGVAHVILAVQDDGSPTLTSYRRIIIRIGP